MMVKKTFAWIGIAGILSLLVLTLADEARLRDQCREKGGHQLRMFTCVKIVEPARPAKEEIIKLDSIWK